MVDYTVYMCLLSGELLITRTLSDQEIEDLNDYGEANLLQSLFDGERYFLAPAYMHPLKFECLGKL